MAHLFKGPVSEPEGEDGAVGRVVVGPCSVCNLPWDDSVHLRSVFEHPVIKTPGPCYFDFSEEGNPVHLDVMPWTRLEQALYDVRDLPDSNPYVAEYRAHLTQAINRVKAAYEEGVD